MAEWISVKESLPLEMEDKTASSGWSRLIRPSDDVLIWLIIEKRQTVAWYSHEQKCWTSVDEKTDYLPREVSHWMPLPEPPKEGGGEDVVKVVLCKDCIHAGDCDCPIDWPKNREDYCSFGERRDDNG